MTSSFRATGAATVRQTPVSEQSVAGATWPLQELKLPMATPRGTPTVPPTAAANAQLTAEEKSRLIDEGYARGLADGERRATAAAQARVDESLGVINQVVTQMREVASLAPAVIEENIAALAVIVARQIVAREVSLDRELVADLVRRALTEFPIEQSVRIRVNPLDLALLTLNGPGGDGKRDMAPITGTRDASWLADARVARGGCLVEGRDRIVDGRVDTALERAYRRMAVIDA
ncbi:MAG TPA: FliH/SctL family protein [Gemmatimonadaceae bacterium]|nr:FliH/SctL family protein [Gemmatimonadaceae bacterium]